MERNGLYGNAALILTKFSLLKSIFEVTSDKLTRFPSDRLTEPLQSLREGATCSETAR